MLVLTRLEVGAPWCAAQASCTQVLGKGWLPSPAGAGPGQVGDAEQLQASVPEGDRPAEPSASRWGSVPTTGGICGAGAWGLESCGSGVGVISNTPRVPDGVCAGRKGIRG